MKISTTLGHIDKVIGYEDSVRKCAKAGFDAVDFSFCAYKNEFESEAKEKAFFLDLKKLAESEGIYFNQAHAHFPSSLNDDKNEERFQDVVDDMKRASYLGVENIVVHPCQHLDYATNVEFLYEYNMEFYKRLIPYCEEYGVHVALENMWQSITKNQTTKIIHSTCSRPDEFIRYVDGLNSDWFVACLDIGHAQLVCEDPADFIRALGSKRLKCLHVHDVDGIRDSHTIPYLGVVDWEKTMKALAEIGYAGDLTFEAHYIYKDRPVELYPATMEFMVKTGRALADIAGL